MPRRIRVGFDGRALASPAGGVRRYARELFGAMAVHADVEVVAIGAPPDIDLPDAIVRHRADEGLRSNAAWMARGLPRAARAARIDLMHAPAYTAPLRGPRPLVLTIHDVSYARHPEWYPYRRDPLRRAFYRWSARTADRVITDSEFSKREIVAAYGLPDQRIDVIPLAPAASFKRIGLSKRVVPLYVLHVGDLHPRRNLEIAVRAVLRVRERNRTLSSLQLFLAGVDRGVGPQLKQLGGEAVAVLGSLDDQALEWMYHGAAALVYPSLYEGFGIPVLEAMAMGTPVIAARAASIPEVAGDAAILLDPHSVDAWANMIEQVATAGSPVATQLRTAGLRRAAEFTWQRTAERTVEVYRRTLEGSR